MTYKSHLTRRTKRITSLVAISTTLLWLSQGANAQFADSTIKVQRTNFAAPSQASPQVLKVCNASLLPPAQVQSPWNFSYCDNSGREVQRCQVFAKAYVAEALSASALRSRVISTAMAVGFGDSNPSGFDVDCDG